MSKLAIRWYNLFVAPTISYSDYLDYWLENYCHVNLKYHTIQAYSNIIKNHIRPRLGFYRLTQITTSTGVKIDFGHESVEML